MFSVWKITESNSSKMVHISEISQHTTTFITNNNENEFKKHRFTPLHEK